MTHRARASERVRTFDRVALRVILSSRSTALRTVAKSGHRSCRIFPSPRKCFHASSHGFRIAVTALESSTRQKRFTSKTVSVSRRLLTTVDKWIAQYVSRIFEHLSTELGTLFPRQLTAWLHHTGHGLTRSYLLLFSKSRRPLLLFFSLVLGRQRKTESVSRGRKTLTRACCAMITCAARAHALDSPWTSLHPQAGSPACERSQVWDDAPTRI